MINPLPSGPVNRYAILTWCCILGVVLRTAAGADAPAQREMLIQKPYLWFPKQFHSVAKDDAQNEREVDFIIDGKIVRREKLSMPDGKPDYWAYLDVREFLGKTVLLAVDELPPGSQALDNITESDVALDATDIYKEPFRPQFHYTVRRGWMNDPNGLLYYKGEYHLFYQTNPLGTALGGYAHWGHAVSTDLIHWHELPIVLYPDERGQIYSGSGVVDWKNTTGFKTGAEPPLVVAYDAPGPYAAQCIAFSNDRGRTFTKYSGNPVLPHFAKYNGDPKIFWYEPAKRWILISTFPKENYGFFSSADLKHWKMEQIVSLPGFECPDFFPLKVQGEDTIKWVLTTNPHSYFTGDFDGQIFTPDSEKIHLLNWAFDYHSAQTFNQIPASDGRRIQIAWMPEVTGAFYHQTLFNQQLSFPTELTLHRVRAGFEIHREPIREIEELHAHDHAWHDLALEPGGNPLEGIKGGLFDIRAEIDPGSASHVGFAIQGVPVDYSVKDRTLSLLGNVAPLEPENGRITLQLLVDRGSVEVFGNHGEMSFSSYFNPKPGAPDLDLFSRDGSAKATSLHIYEMNSMWTQTGAAAAR